MHRSRVGARRYHAPHNTAPTDDTAFGTAFFQIWIPPPSDDGQPGEPRAASPLTSDSGSTSDDEAAESGAEPRRERHVWVERADVRGEVLLPRMMVDGE